MNSMSMERPSVISSKLALILCFTLLFSLISTVFVRPALAKATRAAIVVKVTGTVDIKKAGGTKSYKAFKGMSLNQGDHITTSSGSSLILNVADRDDEITIGANSDLYISDLSKNGAGNKNSFTIWAGSMWVKAKSMTHSDDSFEVQTPTAIMGVRGTQFFTSVDVLTENTKVIVGAGVVKARIITDNSNPSGQAASRARILGEGTDSIMQQNREVILWPTQEADISPSLDGESVDAFVSIMDPDQLVKQTDGSVIEAIVRNKQAADNENAEFIAKKKKEIENPSSTESSGGTLEITTLADLDRLQNNLANAVGNIVNAAIINKKIDKDAAQNMIDEVNKSIKDPDKKIDLTKVKPIKLSDKEEKQKEEIGKVNEEKSKEQDKQEKKEEELKKQYKDLLQQLEEQKKQIQILKQKAIDSASEKAESDYKIGSKDSQKKHVDDSGKQSEAVNSNVPSNNAVEKDKADDEKDKQKH